MYPSDLSDAEWKILAPLFPDPCYDKPKNGRPREWAYRELLDAIFYLTKTGCQWRMLPSEFQPWGTVYSYYRTWKNDGTWKKVHDTLREEVRIKVGKKPQPTAACIDSQSVKTSVKGGIEVMTVARKSKVESATLPLIHLG